MILGTFCNTADCIFIIILGCHGKMRADKNKKKQQQPALKLTQVR